MDVVTGAFSYTGRYIASRLLELGREVRTLTRHPQSASPFGERVRALPLQFDVDALTGSLEGVDTLYNTYWIRFPRGALTFERAVENIEVLLRAARAAGVRRVVYLSVSNASTSSPLPYFRGKGLAEEAHVESELSYGIVRPTVVFGREDVLINNIAWILRKLPLFVIPGSGDYALQPVAVEDVADLTVRVGQANDRQVIDAVGPDVFSYNALVRLIRDSIGSPARIVHASPVIATALGGLLGAALRDTLITRDEIAALTAGLLATESAPTGTRRLADWLAANTASVGASYTSEMRRNWAG
ncbi:MAG TPA: NAD(P)H-binding protein [Gaiellaceae bacterium]|nr:NAD(P)H-binding protein [Gaiellaceae bacterium]